MQTAETVPKSSSFFKQYNFDRVNEFNISQGSVMTFIRCGGQMYYHLFQISLGFCYQKLSKLVHF